jgi:16S rRNA (uracil1498-N3)-methyltransferase
MPRFFIEQSDIRGGAVHIRGKDAEHLRVLRLRPGELVTVCDGRGTDYLCRLKGLGPDSVEAEIISSAPSEAEPRLACAVYAGLPKGDRAELIVQKCVELGAAEVVFFLSERCVSRPDGAGLKKKLERWNKIAEEASKQSGRGVIPPVGFAASFAEMLRLASRAEAGFFLWE